MIPAMVRPILDMPRICPNIEFMNTIGPPSPMDPPIKIAQKRNDNPKEERPISPAFSTFNRTAGDLGAWL
jgi:hypothetical protein